MYYGSKLQIRDVDDIKNEIDALAMFTRKGTRIPGIPDVVYDIAQGWDGKKVFLQDGDALVYPFPKLREVLRYLNEKLPSVEMICAYATPQDILRRSADELKELRQLKLGILHTGLETGDDALLRKIGKDVSSDQMVEAGRKVKEAGIALCMMIILGLGGIEGSRKHALETARVLTEIDPDHVGALTLTFIPGTPLYEQRERNEFHPLSPFQSLEELKLIIENSSFTDCFFSSMHSSNYLSVSGNLPQDKESMLGQIEAVLEAGDPSVLRPESLRGF